MVGCRSSGGHGRDFTTVRRRRPPPGYWPMRPWLHLGHVQCSAGVVFGVSPGLATRDHATALRSHDKLMPLHVNLFIESNPAPVPYMPVSARKIDGTCGCRGCRDRTHKAAVRSAHVAWPALSLEAHRREAGARR